MTPKKLRFVTGMHRSGTTWVGQVVQQAQPDSVLHEPFNAKIGLPGITRWYYGPADRDHVCAQMEALLSGDASYRYRRPEESIFKGGLRRLAGTDYHRSLRKALASSHDTIVLKDPFLSRLGAVLAEHFEAKGAILIRHPAALVHSLRRMGWRIPNLDDAQAPVAYEDEDLQFAFGLGWFWSRLYADVVAAQQNRPDHLLMVKHEDLCLNPLEEGARVLTHLDIPVTDQAKRYLDESTSGDAGQIEGNTLHQMKRSGVALANAWRGRLPEEAVEAVRAGAGDLLENLYPEPQTETSDAGHGTASMSDNST